MASQKLPDLPARKTSQKLPKNLKTRKIIKALKKDGFTEYPVKRGSHRKFKKKENNYVFIVMVPVSSKPIGEKLLLSIIEQAGHTKESFLELL